MKTTVTFLIALASFTLAQAKDIASKDLDGKWYVIGSNVIPFQDGSVEFSNENKMITTWQATRTNPADVIVNQFKFIEPNIIEYSPTFSEKYRFTVSKSDDWITLKSEKTKIYFVLSRKPRA